MVKLLEITDNNPTATALYSLDLSTLDFSPYSRIRIKLTAAAATSTAATMYVRLNELTTAASTRLYSYATSISNAPGYVGEFMLPATSSSITYPGDITIELIDTAGFIFVDTSFVAGTTTAFSVVGKSFGGVTSVALAGLSSLQLITSLSSRTFYTPSRVEVYGVIE